MIILLALALTRLVSSKKLQLQNIYKCSVLTKTREPRKYKTIILFILLCLSCSLGLSFYFVVLKDLGEGRSYINVYMYMYMYIDRVGCRQGVWFM